jgi:hypothetical protein
MKKLIHCRSVCIIAALCIYYLSGINSHRALANPIPVGIPYITMITEDMDISIDDSLNAQMHGVYTFEVGYYLDIDSVDIEPPPWYYTMYFPKPADAHDISVKVNNVNMDFTIVDSLYLTTADSFFIGSSVPDGLDSLDMMMWSFVVDYAALLEVEVNYTHSLIGTDTTDIFLYTLGTGRYVSGWKPPFIGFEIEGKPYVDVSITTMLPEDYMVSDYFPKSINIGSIQTNQYKIGENLVFDWEGQEVECTKDFLLGIKPGSQSGLKEIVNAPQNLWMNISANEIAIYLPGNGRAVIDILDLNGRIVRTIADKNMRAGRHNILWDSARMNIKDGIYIIRLRSGNKQLSRKYVIINNYFL